MKFTQYISLALLIVFTSSCSSWQLTPVKRGELKNDVPEQFIIEQAGSLVEPDWWREFNSTELTQLIKMAYEQNLDIITAWARIREAAALTQKTQSAENLSLDISASAATNTNYEANEKFSTDTFSLGLSATYEIDLWGRLNAATKSDTLAFKATQFDLITTRQLIAKQVATAWANIKTNQALEQLTAQQLKDNLDRLTWLKKRQLKGLSNQVDILQQQQSIASIESSVPPIQETLQLQKNQLALLLGISVSQLPKLSDTELPQLPVLPSTGLPADLLAKRPDVQSAWAALEATDWDLVVARADRLPSFSLTAGATTISDEIHELFDDWSKNLLASILGPLIDGGQRQAEVTRVEAQVDQKTAAYKYTVLEAVKEVDDVLVSEKYKTQNLQALETERNYANQTLVETSRRYNKGLDSYLSVLIAQNTKHLAEKSFIITQGQVFIQRIALYKALGSSVSETLNTGSKSDVN